MKEGGTMNLMDKLSNSVSGTAKSIGKKSTDLMEISKLNRSIRKREEDILKLFEEMGQYVYGRLKNLNYITKEEVASLVNKIKKMEEEIKTLDKLILDIKKINYCEGCEIEVEEDAKFCPLCGRNIKR